MDNKEPRKNPNINELMRMNRTLKELTDFNSSLLQVIPFGIQIINEQGNILFQNNIFQQPTGSEVIGKKCWASNCVNNIQCSDCPLLTGIKTGESSVHEVRSAIDGKTYRIYYIGTVSYTHLTLPTILRV